MCIRDRFRGLIAANRVLSYGKKRKLVLFVGVGKKKYIEVLISGNFYYSTEKVIVEGWGLMVNNLYQTIECFPRNIEFI